MATLTKHVVVDAADVSHVVNIPDGTTEVKLVQIDETPFFMGSNNIPPFGGLFIVLGAAESGKSKFIQKMSDDFVLYDVDHAVVYVGEPDHRCFCGQDAIEDIIFTGWVDDVMGFYKPSTLLLDSLKDAVYGSSGAAMSGGLSSGVISRLSAISARAMRERKLVIATLNPAQDKLLDDLFETLKGTCTGVCEISGGNIVRGSARVWNGSFYDRKDFKDFADLLSSSSTPTLNNAGVPGNINVGPTSSRRRKVVTNIFQQLKGVQP